MTGSLISLLSITAGILGANIFARLFEKHSFGLTGNTIAGVFGSIFIIKSIGRLGFDVNAIMRSAELDIALLTLNLTISLIGGAFTVFFASWLKNRVNS